MLRISFGVMALPFLLSRAAIVFPLLFPFSRAAIVFQSNNIGNYLPDISALNRTMGHPSALWSLGLGLPSEEVVESVPSEVRESEEDDEFGQLIYKEELSFALETAQQLAAYSPEDIKKEGWRLIYSSPLISLLKRRAKNGGTHPGPVEYLMMGRIKEVSPRTFLFAQVNKQNRALWDRTMMSMEVTDDPMASAEALVKGGKGSHDTLYYRTKWPWPLKDRDYTLARRCHAFSKDKAIVLISKSTDLQGYPAAAGVIRVDNYWCHSTIMSDSPDAANASVDSPGLRFVTVFCDDQKVPLPAALVDVISAQGEKVVPGAIERLYHVAKDLQSGK